MGLVSDRSVRVAGCACVSVQMSVCERFADFGVHVAGMWRVVRTRFGGTYTKIGTIQRRLAWPLRKDDTQNREAFHIFEQTHNQHTLAAPRELLHSIQLQSIRHTTTRN